MYAMEPAGIAAAIATDIGRNVNYRPVATDGTRPHRGSARRPPLATHQPARCHARIIIMRAHLVNAY